MRVEPEKPIKLPGGSLTGPDKIATNRDPVEVVEEWVAVALQGRPWEARDCDGEGPCFIERGTARNGDCERFISSPLTDLDAAIIERLLEVARGEAD